MRGFEWCLLLALFAPAVHALDVSVKADGCSKFDHCGVSNRTCSCEPHCHELGTCCINAEKFPLMASNQKAFVCRDDLVATPVFAKRACSEDFRGHTETRFACLDPDRDPADVLDNVPVTSSKTRTTYSNKNCGVCSNEPEEDLLFWTVKVSCPTLPGLDQRFIRKRLFFNGSEWGVTLRDEFVACSILYYPPRHGVGTLQHCTPHMVSSCPTDYPDRKIAELCAYYHGERKDKNSNTYYKNAHCALCNGLGPKQTECPGIRAGSVETSKSTDTVDAFFSDGYWLEREGMDKFQCSGTFRYDPFQVRCRRVSANSKPLFASSAAVNGICTCLFVISVLVLFNKLD